MSTELQSNETSVPNSTEDSKSQEDWQNREAELLKTIEALKVSQNEDKQKILSLENESKALTEEKNNLKAANIKLEKDVVEARKSQNLVDSQEVQVMKQQSEDLLVKAKGIIFEKTKVCQNQELQIEALSQQVASLKEVVSITKDLLEIRNMEVRHLQDKLNNMEIKISLDKEKQSLMDKKMDRVMEMNTDLKREYETQLVLFNALRERYSERELANGLLNNSSGSNSQEEEKQ